MITTVEALRDPTLLGSVALDVRVEEQERDPADDDAKDPALDRLVAHLNQDLELRPAVKGSGGTDRQGREVEVLIDVLLLPLGVDLLADVALAIQEADAHKWQPEIRRALRVVTREDAEPARVCRQRLMQPELGAEVRHRPSERAADEVMPGVKPHLREVSRASRLQREELGHAGVGPTKLFLRGHRREQGGGVVGRLREALGGEHRPKGRPLFEPSPDEVARQDFEAFQKIEISVHLAPMPSGAPIVKLGSGRRALLRSRTGLAAMRSSGRRFEPTPARRLLSGRLLRSQKPRRTRAFDSSGIGGRAASLRAVDGARGA